jgi:hypothetical protein
MGIRQSFTDRIKALRIRGVGQQSRSEKLRITDQKPIKRVQFQLDETEFEESEASTSPVTPDGSFDFDGDHTLFHAKEELHSIGPCNLDGDLSASFLSSSCDDISTLHQLLSFSKANAVDSVNQSEIEKQIFSICIPSILSQKSTDHSSKLNETVLSAMPPLKLPFTYLSRSSIKSSSPSSLKCRPPLASTFPTSSSLKCRRSKLLSNSSSIEKMSRTY